MTDPELLAQYAASRDHDAFADLARHHTPWVYSCAKRLVRDPVLAEDVTQAVFILLSRKAKSINAKHLTGWLFKATRYCAREALRTKSRRLKHEQEAAMHQQTHTSDDQANWEEIWPVLDDAVAQLRTTDRQAILLRFYQGLTFPELGATLGTNEEAARKRVTRALDKLRNTLSRKGISAGAAGLTVVMAEKVTQAAPAQVLERAAAAGGTASQTGTGATLARGATKLMVWSQLRIAAMWILPMVITLGFGTAVLVGNVRASGVLLLPDGRPAEGAAIYPVKDRDVFVNDPVAGLSERGPTSRPGAGAPRTGADGRYSTWTVGKQLLGIGFVHPEGFRFAGPAEARSGDPITLQQWARIDGELGPSLRDPGLKMRLDFEQQSFAEREFHSFAYVVEADVKPDGSFSFEHVPPGRVRVVRLVSQWRHYTGMSSFDHATWVTAEPGGTLPVIVGGSGGSARARIMLADGEPVSPERVYAYAALERESAPPPPAILAAMEAAQRKNEKADPRERYKLWQEWLRTDEGRQALDWEEKRSTRYVAIPDDNGVVVFRDVPPGPYVLRVTVQEHKLEPPWGMGKAIGSAKTMVVLGDSGLVEIGDVRIEPEKAQDP